MFFIFAQCDGNATAAAARYRELHPSEHAPGATAFRGFAACLHSSGSFLPDRTDTGRSCRIPTARLEEVLAEFDRDGTQSVREVGKWLGVRRTTVHRQLLEESMHPYRYVRVHTLQPRDYTQRMVYSRWLLREIARNPSFCRFVSRTDEHYAANVRVFLDQAFHDRWIGRGGAVLWPPRSPDMNPLNFFLWGHLKTAVYREQPVQSREEVVARIHGAVATISRDMLRRVQANIRRRAEACLAVRGGYIEPILATLG
ncbi:hypothetical protein WH47_02229 [Habropoda laboriosa]|uniref:DUF4817 domain-containing protein n=1 Tax=Habropoda laboriosa TaxID=597456 RepID=A0A0L7QJC7_9HYME|nr:hypothetical protein WH47_02229 [Habropoda laboriosa]